VTDEHNKCESCSKRKPNVRYVIDPYDQCVDNIVRYAWLCADCYLKYCDEV